MSAVSNNMASSDVSGDKATYTIGELAEEFRLTLRSIRFYEDEGLLAPSRDGQARLFTRADRARLKLICRGKRLGFSVAEIKQFLDLYSVDTCQHEQMQYLLEHARARIGAMEIQLADVTQTLEELRRIEGEIVAHLAHVTEQKNGPKSKGEECHD